MAGIGIGIKKMAGKHFPIGIGKQIRKMGSKKGPESRIPLDFPTKLWARKQHACPSHLISLRVWSDQSLNSKRNQKGTLALG